MKLKLNNLHLFWGVYIAFLFVLWPQAAWTIGQAQDPQGVQWTVLGVTTSPLAWFLSGVFELTVAIVTHRLNKHWMDMPSRYKAADMARKRFGYRWLNVYALGLIVAMSISAVANYIHVVQFTNTSLKIFDGSEWSVGLYQVIFGLALPGVSFVFARVLSTMQETEQEDDPAFAKAKAELKESNARIRSLEQTIRETEHQHSVAIRQAERALEDSEQRYRAVGDVIRWLFGKDELLRDRIRGIRKEFPKLSQLGIAQLLGCSVSTVNEALQAYLPDVVDAQP
jgi:hypothetical protein